MLDELIHLDQFPLCTVHASWIRFKEGRFIEINSHSLFSKYYSESGKLVQSLFKEISELAEDSNIFLTLLIGMIYYLSIYIYVSMCLEREDESESESESERENEIGGYLSWPWPWP